MPIPFDLRPRTRTSTDGATGRLPSNYGGARSARATLMSSKTFSRRLKVKMRAQFFVNNHPVFSADHFKLITDLAAQPNGAKHSI
jgi:hypothetical protein